MITSTALGKISPIFLTVLLIGALILVELGNPKIKKIFLPAVIVLIIIFAIIAAIDIISKWG